MKLHDLKPDKGSKTARKRVGRGIAAGRGKTAGRGTKGQGARGRRGKRAYFEGGQLPLVRRLPFKRGFTNPFRIDYQEVNLDFLNTRFEDGDIVTPQALVDKGIIRDADKPIVVLGRGELDRKLSVQAHRITAGAQQKIEQAGGSFERLEMLLTAVEINLKRPRKEDIRKRREAASAS